MMQNPNNRLFKPVGILVTSGIGFLISLIAYIITAVNGYYPDNDGVSFLCGSKDLLVISMVLFILVILGVALLVNTIQNKKTQEYVLPTFLTAASAIFGIFMLTLVLAPMEEGALAVTPAYIVSIVSAALAIAGMIFGIIVVANTMRNKAQYQSLLFTYMAIACFALSLGIYSLVSGILTIQSNVLIGVFYIVIAVMEILGVLPMISGLSDSRTR